MDVAERNRLAYARAAPSYLAEIDLVGDAAVRAFCRRLLIERIPGRRVIDLGCGPGIDAEALRRGGFDVLAIDHCAELLAAAAARYPDLRLAAMDLAALTLGDASVDGLYGYASFHHVERAVASDVLRGFARVLVPDGVLVLCLLTSSEVREAVVPAWGGVADNPLHFTYYGRDELGDLLGDAGFTAVECFAESCPAYDHAPALRERGARALQVRGVRAR